MVRAVVRAHDGATVAAAGTSWLSSRYAEVFVRGVEPLAVAGWQVVVGAVCAQLLELGHPPLCIVSLDNQSSLGSAVQLGFRETGVHELSSALRFNSSGGSGSEQYKPREISLGQCYLSSSKAFA